MKNGEEPPAPNSEEWKKWLLEELEKLLDTLPTFSNLDESSSSTLGLFEMVTQMMDKLDNNSILLILGKGSENFQELGSEKIPYSDKDTILEYSYAS